MDKMDTFERSLTMEGPMSPPKAKLPPLHTLGPWNVDYDNDTGPNDDYYEQWFTVGPARIYLGII